MMGWWMFFFGFTVTRVEQIVCTQFEPWGIWLAVLFQCVPVLPPHRVFVFPHSVRSTRKHQPIRHRSWILIYNSQRLWKLRGSRCARLDFLVWGSLLCRSRTQLERNATGRKAESGFHIHIHTYIDTDMIQQYERVGNNGKTLTVTEHMIARLIVHAWQMMAMTRQLYPYIHMIIE